MKQSTLKWGFELQKRRGGRSKKREGRGKALVRRRIGKKKEGE